MGCGVAFSVAGEKLLELKAGSYINKTRASGPDFNSASAYHLEAPFLKGNAKYIIRVGIAAAINAKQPQNKIADQFSNATDRSWHVIK